MLLELAAANAAFAVIKEAVQNSGEIASAGKALSDYFNNKAAIQKAVSAKAKTGVDKSDLEEFMALESLKQQELELKQLFIYHGRGGLWDEWLQFQAQASRQREAERKAKIREAIKVKEKRVEMLYWASLVPLVGILVYLIILIMEVIFS